MAKAILKSLRPKQWAKNVFIFAALIFDRQMFAPGPLSRTIVGFILMCLISSVVYLINDLADIEQDRLHPTKKFRPIASGSLPVGTARITAVLLGIIALPLGFALSTGFGIIILIYFIQNLLYSFWLKHIPIIDVFILATGFLLRVAAGVSLIIVERFSPWLYVCTTLLALFIAFGKRRAEIVLLAENAENHRRVLDGYTIPLLDQFLVIISATTIVAYSLYTFSAENLPGNHLMMLTIPFVVYGIFRYLYLIHVEGTGGAPDELILTDAPLLADILLFGFTSAIILYLFP
ncbi:MAG: decaprenyl-phosphate phosphoribosyltransferase [Anaerolineales bacterium]|nr:decaprenyl-phosphate phosphoribosyltransferase [Anaerolineales bacterium]